MSSERFGGQDPEQWVRDRLAEAGATIATTGGTPPAGRAIPAWVAPAAAAAVVAAIVVGSLAWRHGTPNQPVSPATSPTPTELVTVPDLAGLPAEEATTRLEVLGLVAGARATPGSCATPIVLTQSPATDEKVATGTKIRLEIGCVSTAEERLTEIASRFVSAAHASRSSVSLPIDTPVGLYLGGRHVTDISATESESRNSWDVCVEGYAGRTCPFNALDLIESTDDVYITPETPRHSCAHWPGTPAELTAYSTVSMTVGSNCTDWGAVTLYVNDTDQIVAVDLILAEP